MTTSERTGFGLILLLGFITAIGPFAIDTYLPSLPAIGHEFSVSTGVVQQSASTFFIGLGIGQFIAGPLSDRFGRKPTLLVGFSGFFLASIACAIAPNIETLILARAFQGAFAAVSPAAGRAVVRDLWSGDYAARAMSFVMMVMTIAPLIAPTLGGVILITLGWRAIFVWLMIFALMALFFISWKLPETNLPEKRQNVNIWSYFKAYKTVISNPKSWLYLSCGGFASGSMFAYITGSPFVYIELLDVSPSYFGFFFAFNVFGILLANWLNSLFVVRLGYHKITLIGAGITLLGTILLFIVSLSSSYNLLIIVIGLFISVAPASIIMGNMNIGLLNLYPRQAGAASAVFGIGQYGLGALCSLLVSWFHTDSPLAMSTVMLLAAIISILSIGRLLNHPLQGAQLG